MKENGGVRCNWDADDHEMFLKIRSKHSNNITKLVFLNDCICSMPIFTEEQIKEHISKFMIYEQLSNQKK